MYFLTLIAHSVDTFWPAVRPILSGALPPHSGSFQSYPYQRTKFTLTGYSLLSNYLHPWRAPLADASWSLRKVTIIRR